MPDWDKFFRKTNKRVIEEEKRQSRGNWWKKHWIAVVTLLIALLAFLFKR